MSHSCACTCIAMAIICACVGSVFNVRMSSGFSLKYTRCDIFAGVRVWKLHVLLTTMDMILTWSLFFVMCNDGCLRGSYILCMMLMVSSVLQSVEYLHSMSCRDLLLFYVVSATSCP